MVAPRSFPRPSVSTSVRTSSLTDTPPSPFPSSHKTLHMSPAYHQAMTPLRTLFIWPQLPRHRASTPPLPPERLCISFACCYLPSSSPSHQL
eukprot:582021-Pleurochrysis_carterae.AAC.1